MQNKDTRLSGQSLYTKIYRQHAPALFAYAYRHLSSREDAEDLVVEVFLSVLQNQRFPTFDEKKQEAWLWTITRNKVVDSYRRATRHPQMSVEWLCETLYEDEELSPEQISMRREKYAQLHSAMCALPELQQQVLHLRFGHDLKFDEIARVLEKSEPAIRMMLTRTLRRLRGLVSGSGKGD